MSSQQGSSNLLARLLMRGDSICIEQGQLTIQPASGGPVPPDWLCTHGQELIRQILDAIGKDAYQYQSHKTGLYGRHMSAGLTLQFLSLATQANAYSIFNVELTRARNTRAGERGSPLPAGQFRSTPGSNLRKLWKSTGLPLRRWAAMPDYMGNLSNIIFSGSPTRGRTDGRLDASTLHALNVSVQRIRNAVIADNTWTSVKQASDNVRTNSSDNESAPHQQRQAIQPFSDTCEYDHGKAEIRESGDTTIPRLIRKAPQLQTTEEWLADYERSSSPP